MHDGITKIFRGGDGVVYNNNEKEQIQSFNTKKLIKQWELETKDPILKYVVKFQVFSPRYIRLV